MASVKSGGKPKRTTLTITDKLNVIEQLEKDVPVSNICLQFKIAKRTVSDIKINKEKIKLFSIKFNVGSSSKKCVDNRKHIKLPPNKNLEEAVYKWYTQHRSSGIPVRGVEVQLAAERLAKHMNVNFKASGGWLWRFRKRHNIGNRKTCRESLSAYL